MDYVSNLRSVGNLLCILQGDLQAFILHVILCRNNLFLRIAEKIAGIPVDFHLYIIRFAEMLFAGCEQRVFDRFKQSLFADLFLFLQYIQRFL